MSTKDKKTDNTTGKDNVTMPPETPEVRQNEPEISKHLEIPLDRHTAHVERLLTYAAAWEPETAAPENLAAQALARHGKQQRQSAAASPASGRNTVRPWWGFGTVGLTAAAAALFVCRGVFTVAPTAEGALTPAPSPTNTVVSREVTEVTPAPVSELADSATKPTYRNADMVTNSMISAIGSAAMRSSVSEAASSEPTAAPIRTAAYRPAQRRGIRRPNRIRPRSFERSPVLYATNRNTVRNTVSGTAKKPPVVRWEVEPPSRPQYRMYVPVVLTDGNPDGGESVSATPAVIEVAFDPNMPPQP